MNERSRGKDMYLICTFLHIFVTDKYEMDILYDTLLYMALLCLLISNSIQNSHTAISYELVFGKVFAFSSQISKQIFASKQINRNVVEFFSHAYRTILEEY